MIRIRFFTSHSKSSAAAISIALHLVLLLIAGTFVAVQVVVKSEARFESKQVERPRMLMKKLQVPVNSKKKRVQQPKLRKRIVVRPRFSQSMPDIQMPEITGVKGGLGSGVGGLGISSGIGFNMPEIEIFGVRSKGEKVFIALDSDAYIMRDEVGGKSAFAIIKEELVKVVEGLGPMALFNVAVFDHSGATALFPGMVPAAPRNVAKLREWLDPLNKVTQENIGAIGAYGCKTLGKGGVPIEMAPDIIAGLEQGGPQHWYRPAAMSMAEQADAVFLLSGWWGVLRKADGPMPEWKAKAKWDEYVRKAARLHEEENKRRAAKGEPEQVIRDQFHLMEIYFPEEKRAYYPPQPEWYYYTWKDYVEALNQVRKAYAPKQPPLIGLSKRKDEFSLNVIFFAPRDNPGPVGQFEMLAKRCNGDFRIIKGLEAIEMSVSVSGK